MHHKSAKNHVKIHSLVNSAEEALTETRVQKPKCCFNLSEQNYYYIYISRYINVRLIGVTIVKRYKSG